MIIPEKRQDIKYHTYTSRCLGRGRSLPCRSDPLQKRKALIVDLKKKQNISWARLITSLVIERFNFSLILLKMIIKKNDNLKTGKYNILPTEVKLRDLTRYLQLYKETITSKILHITLKWPLNKNVIIEIHYFLQFITWST